MPKNLEIKAKIIDTKRMIDIAENLQAQFEGILFQTDTYFNTNKGRLKLREFSDGKSELIFYLRDEDSRYRQSHYQTEMLSNPSKIKLILEESLGVKTKVIKKRIVYIYKGIRIHIDEVEDIGNFIEFEIPTNNESAEASRMMDFLIHKFEIKAIDLIQHSYSDLLMNFHKL